MEREPLLTAEQVAAYLGVHVETVRKWLRDGTLRGFLPGGKRSGWRVRPSDLDQFIAERQGNAAA